MSSRRFDDIAARALAEYDIATSPASFIRHSDCVTYRVRSESGSNLLRIHVPLTAAMGAHGADPLSIASELMWLEALGRGTELVLQSPVRNRLGELVTQVDDGAGGTACCSLLRWV